MTFPRSLQIRRHAQQWGLENLVLETDAPDIPPAWLHPPDRRNTPAQVAGVAQALAELRGMDPMAVAAATAATALRVLPRLAPIVA
jgi:TatD DNase family protein